MTKFQKREMTGIAFGHLEIGLLSRARHQPFG